MLAARTDVSGGFHLLQASCPGSSRSSEIIWNLAPALVSLLADAHALVNDPCPETDSEEKERPWYVYRREGFDHNEI